MSTGHSQIKSGKSETASLASDPRVRSVFIQSALAVLIIALVAIASHNAATNLARAGIASGFGFFSDRAGFEITLSAIPFDSNSTYLRAFFVGLLNTLIIAISGIIISTVIGVMVGIGQLSSNLLVRIFSKTYVEILRNIPLLLLLLFWYKAVLSVLPPPRGSFAFFNQTIFFNNRGIFLPKIVLQENSIFIGLAFVLGVFIAIFLNRWARARQIKTGQQFPIFSVSLLVMLGLPLLAFIGCGFPIEIEFAQLSGFNFVGGQSIRPEFVALLLGLSLYNAAFIAEILRAAILSVPSGQSEAARSLGLRPNRVISLVIIPQAMRVAIPPLTSQYLNLTKNSSLAVAIGYPDLFGIFAGLVLNQTGQAIEIISITMLVYLTISLSISLLMNSFNNRVALVER